MARRRVTTECCPSLPRHIKRRFDEERGQWIVLAPERVLVLDDMSNEILLQCDGENSVASIVESLAESYDASPQEIEQDVMQLLQDLADKGFLRP